MDYKINYDDDRFKQVEQAKDTRLNEVNNQYKDMIDKSDEFYQKQTDAQNKYAAEQQKNQQARTDQTIDLINQQKEQAGKDYTKEQKGAYTDYLKATDQYGYNAEVMAASGLTNTGVGESSKVSMYNTYQNRVSTARESYNKALLNYDNNIKDAQLANNEALAKIAYETLLKGLELALQGFQYKNTLLQSQMNAHQTIDDTYYSRYQDVLSQINSENSLAEQIRQYNESLKENQRQYDTSLAYQKERDKITDSQWQKQYELSKQQTRASSKYYESLSSSNDNISDNSTSTTYAKSLNVVKSLATQPNGAALVEKFLSTQLSNGALTADQVNSIKQQLGISTDNTSNSNNDSTTVQAKSSPNSLSYKSYDWYSKNFKSNMTLKELNEKLAQGLSENKLSQSDVNKIYALYGVKLN
nr:MAG TPA: hypothetical protein [Caudoviricetes sp.]